MYDNDTRLDIEFRQDQINKEKSKRLKNKHIKPVPRPKPIYVGDWAWIPTIIQNGINGYIQVKAFDIKEADKKSYLLGNGMRLYNHRSAFEEIKKGIWRANTFGYQ